VAKNTNIEWTDSTFNPWWGCTRIGAGCDNCYAAALDKRTGGRHWESDIPYRELSDNNWNNPHKWQRQAPAFFIENGRRRRVFCASMADVFDSGGPQTQRERLWDTISQTPDLNWLLLTKRPRNINRYLRENLHHSGNIWLGTSVENKRHGLPRIDVLREAPARIRFLSVEPLLEDLGQLDLTGIHWVIVGGESGPGARPMKKEWLLSIRNQCLDNDIPFFFKQWGIGKSKGGCLLNGQEYKAWPEVAKQEFDIEAK
jgi:protein gp37